MSDIFNGVGIEIKLKNENDFLKIKETLTRIGIASKWEKKLYASCHILHKQGRYVILHFKELFILDNIKTNFTEEDRGRRNTITSLLEEWGLLEVVDKTEMESPRASLSQIKILPFKEKDEWELIPKYHIGRKKSN